MSEVRPVHPVLRALALVSSGGLFTLLLVHSGGAGCTSSPPSPEPGAAHPEPSDARTPAESAATSGAASAAPSSTAVAGGGPSSVPTFDPNDPQYFGTSKAGPIHFGRSTSAAPKPAPQPPPANQAPTPPGGR